MAADIKATVKQVSISIRRPLGPNDAGLCECGHYIFVDGVVTLTDESGTPLRRGLGISARKPKGAIPLWTAPVLATQAAHQVAGRLLHTKYSSERSGSDFNRPLSYPPVSVA